MKTKRVWNTVVLALTAGSLWTVAQGCGPSIGSFCNKVCECIGCSQSQREDCVDSLDDQKKAADKEGCGSEFNDYLSCQSSELECDDGFASADGCDFEAEALSKCTNGSVIGGNVVQAYCSKACECMDCSSDELEDCVTSLQAFKQDPQGCGSELDVYLGCLASQPCEGGSVSFEACESQAIAFTNCFGGSDEPGSGSGGASPGGGSGGASPGGNP